MARRRCALKVILRARVKGLGEPGAVVEVAPGYARNYLLPRGLAEGASDAALHQLESDRQREATQTARLLSDARAVAARLAGATITIEARAGAGGRLFGAVTSQAVAQAIAGATGLVVDRRRIALDEPIKTLGLRRLDVRLHPEVVVQIDVQVVAAGSAIEGGAGAAAPSGRQPRRVRGA